MIDLTPDQLCIVRELLQKHVPAYDVWAFGSRVKGTAKKFSDLDLVVQADKPLSLSVMGRLREAFSESDLSMKVDIVDFHRLTPEFQKAIQQHHKIIQKKSTP